MCCLLSSNTATSTADGSCWAAWKGSVAGSIWVEAAERLLRCCSS
jgi:hypothetical protein